MTTSLATLILAQTKAQIYDFALGIATSIGLPVSSWQAGDPTRSLYHVEAEMFTAMEPMIGGYIRSGFLDYAEEDWLPIVAKQGFGVTVRSATFATCDVTITNPGGGFYPDRVAGDLVFKNTSTNVTYTSTSGGTLASGPGTTLTVSVVADVAGSDGSAGAGDIDELVTPMGSSTCTNALAAVGVDSQSREAIIAACRARRGRATPNGPKDAYFDTAIDPELTGTSNVTDARAYRNGATGNVSVYLRGPSGAVAEVDRALVETAILENATPLCVTPTVLSCSNVTVAVTYTMKLYKRANVTAAEASDLVETALESLFAARPIGGDIVAPATTGKLYVSMLVSAILGTFPGDAFDVVVSAPAGDTALTNAQVAALGVVTPTITLVANPT